MSNDSVETDTAKAGTDLANDTRNDKGDKPDTETKEPKEAKSVSFNRDVHVKRFGKPRETRSSSSEKTSIRKEPFTHLSEEQLIEEANRVRAQAESVTCTADHPPEKFFSLPHRRKREDRVDRRNSDEGTEGKPKPSLGRSTSDISSKKKRERTSLSTLFRRAQRNKSPDGPVLVTKPNVIVKRSKSDVSDLKSSNLNLQKPIRKRSGSETEEFLKSLRNKKTQLSPIIESSPRDDYFKKTPPLEAFLKQKLAKKDSIKSDDTSSEIKKINPVEKPPRYKSPEKNEPKPPIRTKRGRSAEKEKSPPITDTPKRKTEVKKTLLVDEIDSIKAKDINPTDIKDRIKEKIRKIEDNIYGTKDMIHSSQRPPVKPPLTRGHTVDPIVRILKEKSVSPPPKSHLLSPSFGANANQPFSYIKSSASPDPSLFARNLTSDRISSPLNKMNDKGVVYAQVIKDKGESSPRFGKNSQTFYSPLREKCYISDEDEGLGYEDRYKYSTNTYDYDQRNSNGNLNKIGDYKITDSPIRPRFREYEVKLPNFDLDEPTYANEAPSKEDDSQDYIDGYRGRADGMDTRRNLYESEINKVDVDFNQLSHRRQLLESRMNSRRIIDRERIDNGKPISRYIAETDPIYEAEKRMKATEKYVNETARYYSQTLDRDGFTENSITEDYNRYDSENQNTEYQMKSSKNHMESIPYDMDRREFIDSLDRKPRFNENSKSFPPEPEYEPPVLDKKFKGKKHITTSQDFLQTGQKYKGKDEHFGKRKSHYASNPEIAKLREEDYANLSSLYHDSLKRVNKKEMYKESFGVKSQGSSPNRDFYREETPRRFDVDNRLVDSGIENDFRKDSGELHVGRHRRHGSDDDVRDTSMFLANERRHTEDNFPSEQTYANGEYVARFKDYKSFKKYGSRDSVNGSNLDPKRRYDKSPSRRDNSVSAKPPKATKMLSGLEKVKKLFSRDSSKKSKKEKEVHEKTRTRVLKSPEHLAEDDSEYRRFTDPEPSDMDDKRNYRREEEGRVRSSREDLDRRRGSEPRDSDGERSHRRNFDNHERTIRKERRYHEHTEEKRRHNSSERESDRPSDVESERRRSKSKVAGSMDSPALAERYRERRRLATPSPTPSPPRKPAPNSATNWFRSLDRLANRKKTDKEKVSESPKAVTPTEDSRKNWTKSKQNSPAKNLRFFGDTDVESDSNTRHSTVTKSRSHPQSRTHETLRKTTSNSSTGIDETDADMTKSYSLSNLQKDDTKHYKRNLQNISEIHSNSESESRDRRMTLKPPINPYDRSRSRSSSKTLKGSKSDLRRNGRSEERGSASELRGSRQELRGSKQELRGSKPELRDKHRRRTPGPPHSGESSTEDSNHSQRSVVYLHATTVGDIPDPGHLARQRSRDDVSSVNSSTLVRTTTKSFSLFAPWTPKHYPDHTDVHYAQRPRRPKKKEETPNLQKNKSYSQTTLTRKPQNSRLTSSSTTLNRRPEKVKASTETLTRKTGRDGSQSNEVLNQSRERVSRSISMPKDGKKAGWFKLTKNKKPEVNTRVR